MRRQICWKEKSPEGKTDIRVTIHGQDIKWQFKRSGSEEWDYATQPTSEQWDTLADALRNRYQRGHLDANDILARIRQLRRD